MTPRRKTDWYTACRREQERWKSATLTLPDDARAPGLTWVQDERGGRKLVGPFPICLPLEHAAANLLPGIRAEALSRFIRHEIEWHHGGESPDGTPWPCGHLLDSQVQCVNTLLTLAHEPGAILDFALAVEPEAETVVDVEDGSPVAFEWVGLADHLGEWRGRPPTKRGRFTTSADALMVARRRDGGRTGIIVEWKYTESYAHPKSFWGDGGTDRREVYRARYERGTSAFRSRPPIEAYFHEPHYQLLRLTLLADAMVSAAELGIDRAVVVHAVPRGNDALLRTVPGALSEFGATVPEVWTALVGGGPVRWRWLDTTPWLGATEAMAERYAPQR